MSDRPLSPDVKAETVVMPYVTDDEPLFALKQDVAAALKEVGRDAWNEALNTAAKMLVNNGADAHLIERVRGLKTGKHERTPRMEVSDIEVRRSEIGSGYEAKISGCYLTNGDGGHFITVTGWGGTEERARQELMLALPRVDFGLPPDDGGPGEEAPLAA
jgi:hypothetical protein